MRENYLKSINVCMIFLSFTVLSVSLKYMQNMLVPLVFAFFVYVIVDPLVEKLEMKYKLPEWLSVALVFIGVVLTFVVIGFVISSSVGTFYKGAGEYKEKVLLWVGQAEVGLKSYGFSQSDYSIADKLKNLELFSIIRKISSGLAGVFGNLLLVLVFSLFLIVGGSNKASRSSAFLEELKSKISQYLITKTLMSFVTGALVWIVLASLGLQLAFMFAILTLLLNFIPTFGSMVATLLPLPIALLQFGFGWELLVITIVPLSIQFSIGNIFEPKIMGDNMDLHPVTILFFLIFWGQIWGVAGMFLAVPITAILKIVLFKIPSTRSVAELLAGRWAFSN